MKQEMLSISALCMLAALCSQLLSTGKYSGVIRIAFAMEIVRIIISALDRYSHIFG